MSTIKVRVKATVGLGRPVEIDAEPTMTIRQVKERVGAENVVDPNSMAIVFNGKTLSDGMTLKDAGITDGSVLSAAPQNMEGGACSFRPHSSFLAQRLRVEQKLLLEEGIDLKPGTDPFQWRGYVDGKGRWHGKKFPIRIELPDAYPYAPPNVFWLDSISPRHPNINTETQWTCLSILTYDWKPFYTLVTACRALEWLFENPNYKHNTHGAIITEGFLDGLLRRIKD